MNNCKTIAIANQKGGVGKTTTTASLGIGLAQAGNRVLLVDGDPQGSLTISLGYSQPDSLDTTLSTAMYSVIQDDETPWTDGILHHPEGVDLLPANMELSGIELSLFTAMNREQVLKTVLSPLKERYDYILIDCMPFLGLMTVNALVAADSVIIPSQPDFLSTKGLNLLIRTISKVRRQINPRLQIDGMVSTDARFTMDNLNLGDNYTPLGAHFRKANGDIVNSQKSIETVEKELSVQEAMAEFFSGVELGVDTFKTINGNEFTIVNEAAENQG